MGTDRVPQHNPWFAKFAGFPGFSRSSVATWRDARAQRTSRTLGTANLENRENLGNLSNLCLRLENDVSRQADCVEALHEGFGRLPIGILGLELDLDVPGKR